MIDRDKWHRMRQWDGEMRGNQGGYDMTVGEAGRNVWPCSKPAV